MAITLVADCPRCFTKNTFFSLSSYNNITNRLIDCAFICTHCRAMSIVRINDQADIIQVNIRDRRNLSIDLRKPPQHIYIEKMIPKYPSPKVLDHLPSKVSKYFLEAQEQLINGHFETSISVSRKVLEIASVQKLDEKKAVDQQGIILSKAGLIERPLRRRIDSLFENNLITQDMHDWVTLIREDGNNAIHSDEDYTEEEAQELIDFTEVFLMYLYTLPQMVIEKRKSKQTTP